MRTFYASENHSILPEGQVFPFTVLKHVSLGSNENYWVLQDPYGYKVLLPSGFYEQYGIMPGMEMFCRVDKINCKGQMFLEPEHPHYVEGNSYDFPIIKGGKSVNFLDETEFFYLVEDVFGNHLKVYAKRKPEDSNNKTSLSCIVERIKKGRLFLKVKDDIPGSASLQIGEWYWFKIISEILSPEDQELYYILSGPDKKKHLLKKKYYLHYNLKLNDEVFCRVEKFTARGDFILEPQHPCYKTGHTYVFWIFRIEDLAYSDGHHQKVAVVSDCFKQELRINIKDLPSNNSLNTISGRILTIRKSRPEIELVSFT